MTFNLCNTVHKMAFSSIYLHFGFFIQLIRWARCDLYYIFTITDRFRQKKTTTREWEGMGVILPGVERDGIFPQFFRGIGTGRDSFLWEWDGRGLRIHSRVTL